MPAADLFGQATGIGSLPHAAPAEALELVFTYCKHLPHWPQLPRRSPAEGFAAQYLAPLLQRGLVREKSAGSLSFTDGEPGWEERLLAFYELVLDEKNLPGFAFPAESAAGFYAFMEAGARLPREAIALKGQISGPVTVGFQVTGAGGKPSFYDQTLREILVQTLAWQARWQAAMLRSLGKPALVFIDDPGLYSYGSSTAIGLGKAEIQDAIREIAQNVRAAGGMTGVHCCAGPDWSLVLELPLDFVSFDAYEYFPSMQVCGKALDRFLAGGGALAWGIVPASEQALNEDVSSLRRALEEKMEALAAQGAGEAALRRRFMITPSCGTGSRSPEVAERVYRLAAALAEILS